MHKPSTPLEKRALVLSQLILNTQEVYRNAEESEKAFSKRL